MIARLLVCISAAIFTACGPRHAVTISATGHRPPAEVDSQGRANAAAFFRRPKVSHVRLSPDGRQLAGVISKDGLEMVVVIPLNGDPLRPLASLERNERFQSWTVGQLGWGSNDRLLVSVRMPGLRSSWSSTRQSRLLVIDIAEKRVQYLGRRWRHQEYTQYQDNIISFLSDDPSAVLIALWIPDQKGVGARRVDLQTGALKTVAFPRRGTLGWAADHLERVRIGWGEARWESRNFVLARASEDEDFEEILSWNPHLDTGGFTFAGFATDPKTIYVFSRTPRGRRGIYSFDLETKKMGEALFAPPDADVNGLAVSGVDGRLLAASYVTDKPRMHFFDDRYRRLREQIDAALPGRTNAIVSSDRAEQRFVVRSSADVAPPSYFLLEAQSKALSRLFDAYPELMKTKLAPMEPIRYTARDGLEIHGYLTRPADGSTAPFPIIVMPHGGPWARDVWGWDREVQFLASRGFAVLQPNFRGSTGYGQDFFERGRGRWGLEMQDDITDGARWAIREGIADRDRIGIYGASYGGYAALRALQKEPDLFRAGASFAGVTDLPLLLSDDAEFYGLVDDMEALVGDRWDDSERLEEASPVQGAGRIRGAVLIAHGTEDPRVQVDHATRMASALEDAGANVETYLYEGEVHGFLDERNAIDFYTRLAAFFTKHLQAPTVAERPFDGARIRR